MRRRTRALVLAGALLVLAAAGGGAWAVAGGGDEGGSLTADERQNATAAALEATGGGTANELERDGENGATFEVEVTKPDGTTVDVRLDERYEVVTIEGDAERGGPDDRDGDD